MNTAQTSPSNWAALLSGANGVRSLALAGGVVLHAINVYIATTILPSVVEDIGGIDYYAWNTTLFVAASILGSALSARLLGRLGPRGAYLVASLVFAGGALACAFAPSMPVMLVGRLVQGLGGGFLFALSYAMIRLVFDERLWPRAMALVSGMWGVATLVGPAVGGVFAELGIWRAAFWSLIPVAGLFAVLAAAVLPGRSTDRVEPTPLPITQLWLLTAAVLSVSAGSVSSTLPLNLLGLAAAALFTGLLIITESRARHRLLPAGAFRLTTALGALYATMALLAVTVTSGEIFVPLFLQVLHHRSPLVAGYLAALMAAGWTLGSIASASITGANVRRTDPGCGGHAGAGAAYAWRKPWRCADACADLRGPCPDRPGGGPGMAALVDPGVPSGTRRRTGPGLGVHYHRATVRHRVWCGTGRHGREHRGPH